MNLSVRELRKKHSRFIYHSFKTDYSGDELLFTFHFELEPDIHFYPALRIAGLARDRVSNLGTGVLANLAFQIGMMEIPSYWKSACSQEILIKCGYLEVEQSDWWEDLLIHGMGEFFFLNGIDFTGRNFLKIRPENKNKNQLQTYGHKLDSANFLIPVAGGKDSAVSCEILRKNNKNLIAFCLNPTAAAEEIIKINNIKNSVIVSRQIDKTLMNLNRSGYLNGHTPFTAYTSFLSSVCSVLVNAKFILMSNERSSNEGNVKFHGVDINHQYSKSYGFEKKFREYSQKYIAGDLEYISFLRPLFELQIAKIFSRFPEYFPVFKSCNVNQKLNSWCHNCAKCLFVYTILFPFLDKKILTTAIFSHDLFDKPELLPLLRKFLEDSGIKPFDCVGTRDETAVAFQLCLEKSKAAGEKLPLLLRTVSNEKLIKIPDVEQSRKMILAGWNEQNFLTAELTEMLKNEAVL